MKLNMIIIFICLILLGGCATSPYRIAEEYVENMEFDRAVREYVLMLDPHTRDGKNYIYYDREILTRIGAAYWQKQSYETAIKILRIVTEKDPEFGKALYYLVMSHEALGDEDQAIQISKGYTTLSTSDPFRRVLFGRVDYLIRRKIDREIQAALQNEALLQIADFPEKSVAVLYFLDFSDDPQWAPLQKGLAEMLITDLSQAEELKVIERLRLNGLMEELQLSATGLMDEQTATLFGSAGTISLREGTLFAGKRGDERLEPVKIPEHLVGGWRVEEEFINAIRGLAPIAHTTFADGLKYMQFTEAVARSFTEYRGITLPLFDI